MTLYVTSLHTISYLKRCRQWCHYGGVYMWVHLHMYMYHKVIHARMDSTQS
jgi:hypothetical protein